MPTGTMRQGLRHHRNLVPPRPQPRRSRIPPPSYPGTATIIARPTDDYRRRRNTVRMRSRQHCGRIPPSQKPRTATTTATPIHEYLRHRLAVQPRTWPGRSITTTAAEIWHDRAHGSDWEDCSHHRNLVRPRLQPYRSMSSLAKETPCGHDHDHGDRPRPPQKKPTYGGAQGHPHGCDDGKLPIPPRQPHSAAAKAIPIANFDRHRDLVGPRTQALQVMTAITIETSWRCVHSHNNRWLPPPQNLEGRADREHL